MSKKDCELCSKPATMFCDSDQASLCWDCDEKVHAANFLVAKHSRTLLCHLCRSPTPWKAAGPKLRPTVSVCQPCGENRATSSSNRREDERDFDSDSQESESDDGGEYNSDSEYCSDEEEDDGENQVVPWAAETASDCCSEGDNSLSSSSKRSIRDYASFDSEDEEDGCYSSHNRSPELGSERLNFRESESNYGSSSALSLSRPLKMRRTSDSGVLTPGGGQTTANTAERRRY